MNQKEGNQPDYYMSIREIEFIIIETFKNKL